jgi:hypothetical protein
VTPGTARHTMRVRLSRGFLLLALLIQPCVAGAELRQSVSIFPELDLQRSIGTDAYLRAIYDLLAWEHLRASLGVSLSFTPVAIDGYYLDLGIDDVAGTGLGAHLKLMGDQYVEEGRAANTIGPSVVWRWRSVDLAFGVTWRFLVVEPASLWCFSVDDPAMVEPVFSYKIGAVLNLIDERWTLSVSLSNQDEFTSGTFGAFTLRLGSRVALGERWGALLDVLYRPAGTVALTAVNSVLVIRLGGTVRLP